MSQVRLKKIVGLTEAIAPSKIASQCSLGGLKPIFMEANSDIPNQPTDSNADFRTVLINEFERRKEKNARYSLRAFAKALELSPSSLSAILRSKRKPSASLIHRLGPELGLSEPEVARFAQNAGEVFFQELPIDIWDQIADWHHYAILELTNIDGFKPSTAYVAKALSISEQEVRLACDRLVKVGLLEITEAGWKDLSVLGNVTNMTDNTTAASKRKMQRQLLEKGISSLENVPFEDRLNRSMIVGINKKDLPEARERIVKFCHKLLADLGETRSTTDVYNLSIALFPLTNEVKS